MKKIPVWKNVLLLVATLVTIIIATLAWFYTGPRASVEGMDIQLGRASYVQISGDNGENWSENLEVEIGINKNFKEISGNGTSFYAPVYEVVRDEEGLATHIISFSQDDAQGKYYEQVFDFRSDVAQDIYLSAESSVTAVNELGNSYIDGAIRVAFFELDEAGNETLKCIWAPNSTVKYSAATNSFTRQGSVEPYYYYQKSGTFLDPDTLTDGQTSPHLAKISTAGTDRAGCGYNSAYKFMWSNGENLPSNAPSLLTLTDSEGEDFTQSSLKVKVWLEGYDRECVNLLSGQKFTMKLQFSAKKGE